MTDDGPSDMSDTQAPVPRALRYRVITFYSYKGGVGRSMALANVAALLAGYGRKVLVVDFDLEAPGLQQYFDQKSVRISSRPSGRNGKGLVELFDAYRRGTPLDWRRCIVRIRWGRAEHGVDLIPAGGGSGDYAQLVQSLNWDELFSRHGFGEYLCKLREEWRDSYDVVLIDSRTGMSDIGGICTILLPDALIMLFTANQQSIEGTSEVVRRARAAQETLPVERGRLLAIPILSRDDRRTEYEQSEEWRLRIAEEMEDFFGDWVWTGVTPDAVLQKLYLPQIAYWSFGERLPVLERPGEVDDPSSLGAAYRRLARLIDADLNWEALASEKEVPDRKSAELEGEAKRLARMVRWMAIGMVGVLIMMSAFGYLYFRAEDQRNADNVRLQAQSREQTDKLIAAMREQSARQQRIIQTLEYQLRMEQERRRSSGAAR